MSGSDGYGRRRTGTVAIFNEFSPLNPASRIPPAAKRRAPIDLPFRQTGVQPCPGVSRRVQACNGKLPKKILSYRARHQPTTNPMQTRLRTLTNGCERPRATCQMGNWRRSPADACGPISSSTGVRVVFHPSVNKNIWDKNKIFQNRAIQQQPLATANVGHVSQKLEHLSSRFLIVRYDRVCS